MLVKMVDPLCQVDTCLQIVSLEIVCQMFNHVSASAILGSNDGKIKILSSYRVFLRDGIHGQNQNQEQFTS